MTNEQFDVLADFWDMPVTNPTRRQQVAEAVAHLRAKRKEAGLVRLELWVHRDDAKHVKAYAEYAAGKRKENG